LDADQIKYIDKSISISLRIIGNKTGIPMELFSDMAFQIFQVTLRLHCTENVHAESESDFAFRARVDGRYHRGVATLGTGVGAVDVRDFAKKKHFMPPNIPLGPINGGDHTLYIRRTARILRQTAEGVRQDICASVILSGCLIRPLSSLYKRFQFRLRCLSVTFAAERVRS
jgi:hypothetical protein